MTIDIPSSSRNGLPHWRNAVTLGILSLLLALFCLELILVSGQISPLWLSTALMTIVVFRHPVRDLFLLLPGCFVGIILAHTILLGPSIAHLHFALINLAQSLLGGYLLRLLLNRHAPLESLFSWSKMVLAVGVVTPILGGLLATWLLEDARPHPVHFFTTWVISEVIGMLALGPVCLLWHNHFLRRSLNRQSVYESIITLLSTLLLCYLVLRFLPWPFTFVILILLWSAVRLPRLDAFLVFLLNIAMMSLMMASHQLDHLITHIAFFASTPWLPLLLTLIPSHVMTLVMHSLREEKKHISESGDRFRNAMEYSAIGMALVSPNGVWMQVNQSLCHLLGYHQDELKRLTFQQITHPDDLNADLQQLASLLSGEIQSYTMEKRYFRKDGQVVWALLAVSLVRDAEAQPLYFIAQIEDVTELKHTNEENRRLMERITLANEAGGIGVWEWTMASNEMSWNRQMFEIYQLSPEEKPTYLFWLQRVVKEDRTLAELAVKRALNTCEPLDMEFRIQNGSDIRYIRLRANPILNKEGRLERMLGINQDITELRALNEALFREKERMLITLDAIGEAVISTDKKMLVTFMNPVAERMTGWTQENAAGKPLAALLRMTRGRHGPEIKAEQHFALPASTSPSDTDHDLVLHNSAGEKFEIHYSITPLKTLEGETIGSVIVMQDVSESREILKQLSYSASHDMLTLLPNRTSFEHQLKRLLASASDNQQHTLTFIDLDRFKAINDSAGHAAGDALLRELAHLMTSHLRSSDMLARLGGDEFGLLIADSTTQQTREIVQRMVDAINDYRFQWGDSLYRIGASAGITQINQTNCVSSDVLSQADLACYNAKHNGRGQVSIFEPRLQRPLRQVNSREENAILIETHTLRLMAWAVAPPNSTQSARFWLTEIQLISAKGDIIEETDLRHSLQDAALFLALDRKIIAAFFARYASEATQKAITLALPLSHYGLQNDAIVTEIISHLEQNQTPATQLYFLLDAEMLPTEHLVQQKNIARLRALGCRFVLRNFCNNLNALNLLRADHIDFLMFNANLIANVHFNLMDEMMVSIIHGHAHRLNIATIAGPLTLPASLATFTTLGIDMAWGEAVAVREPLKALLMNRSDTN
nr:diguanylate cyclase [Pantoea sp. 201603H]